MNLHSMPFRVKLLECIGPQIVRYANSFLARGDFSHLLIYFVNSLDPDEDRQNVGPDLDPNSLTL